MMLDGKLTFNTTFGTADAIGASGSGNFPTVIDLTGVGSGNAPTMIGGYPATNTAIGADIGQGDGMAIPYLYVVVTVTFTTLTSLVLLLEAAPDGGSYSPGAYTTIFQSEAIPVASLTAGAYFQVQVPPRALSGQPGEALPRFYRLAYTVNGSEAGAGSMLAGFTINPFNGLVNTLYPENFQSV